MSSMYLARSTNAYSEFYDNITGEKNRFKPLYNKFKAVAHSNVWTYHFLKTIWWRRTQVCCDNGCPCRVPAEESAALKNILIFFQWGVLSWHTSQRTSKFPRNPTIFSGKFLFVLAAERPIQLRVNLSISAKKGQIFLLIAVFVNTSTTLSHHQYSPHMVIVALAGSSSGVNSFGMPPRTK